MVQHTIKFKKIERVEIMKVGFEEKTYESWFNVELASTYPIFFPPGQVCEGYLGFDAAFFLDPTINKNFQDFQLPEGVYLKSFFRRFSYLLPRKIRTNCFFQYKRPEYLTETNANEWSYWEEPYFRYGIDTNQQGILEALHTRLNNQALVLYASPAAKNINELWLFYQKKELIQNSNFTEAHKLNSHHINTYTKGGTHNQAFSESEKIETLSFDEYLKFIQAENVGTINFFDNAIKVANVVEQIMSENEVFGRVFREMMELFDRNNEILHDIANIELRKSLYIMNQFNLLTNIQWCCVCEERNTSSN
ncbi:hypothetical protein MIS45_02605 [Wielerella bovis]|uniref:hypothetical protein n=1 Tax=Wielerella bovis TaxID=2917790 RepID=UPI00201973A6|nr:hypothetical protein [Wielerella bovis]ULJ69759.1 hypothetical protein MIS45_02605 [Wielerella bovis]